MRVPTLQLVLSTISYQCGEHSKGSGAGIPEDSGHREDGQCGGLCSVRKVEEGTGGKSGGGCLIRSGREASLTRCCLGADLKESRE